MVRGRKKKIEIIIRNELFFKEIFNTINNYGKNNTGE